jgi:hypothetical protein
LRVEKQRRVERQDRTGSATDVSWSEPIPARL